MRTVCPATRESTNKITGGASSQTSDSRQRRASRATGGAACRPPARRRQERHQRGDQRHGGQRLEEARAPGDGRNERPALRCPKSRSKGISGRAGGPAGRAARKRAPLDAPAPSDVAREQRQRDEAKDRVQEVKVGDERERSREQEGVTALASLQPSMKGPHRREARRRGERVGSGLAREPDDLGIADEGHERHEPRARADERLRQSIRKKPLSSAPTTAGTRSHSSMEASPENRRAPRCTRRAPIAGIRARGARDAPSPCRPARPRTSHRATNPKRAAAMSRR